MATVICETARVTFRPPINAATSCSATSASGSRFDLDMSKESGKYASGRVPSELDEELHAANLKVYELEGLVLDDGIRDLVNRAHSALNPPGPLANSNPKRAESLRSEADMVGWAAQEAIAKRVRDIYGGQTS